MGSYFPDQPADVNVFWGDGQCSDTKGDFIKKTDARMHGRRDIRGVLYHCGLEDKIPGILAHTTVSTAMMPYITSQFMPRKISDRPKVIPEGCVNLAFIGQFVELPGDVVFTVETSVRTAMMAVWGLTGLNKPMIPIYEPVYDLRVIIASLKATLGIDEITPDSLKAIAPPARHCPLCSPSSMRYRSRSYEVQRSSGRRQSPCTSCSTSNARSRLTTRLNLSTDSFR